ncbi:hypothetical protein Q4I28_003661 [Leishmania naiffi]|uniref:BAG domain-containing protein n=1 Tax=Leishmania naiffi TaxID=5678 RepID=A0AAW3BUL9_9TRYP
MWASWRSSATLTPEASTSAYAAASPSPLLFSFSSSIAASPQWRLISTISHKACRQLAKYPAHYIYISAVAGLVFTVTGTVLAYHIVHRGESCERYGRRSSASPTLSHGARTSSGCAAGQSGGVKGAKAAQVRRGAEKGDDDIEFADPAERAFFSYVHRIKTQKEAPLLAALTNLETAAAELVEVRRRHVPQGDLVKHESSEGGDERGHDSSDAHSDGNHDDVGDHGVVAEAQAKVYRLAAIADELLTQWICSLDGVPVRQSEALKQQRKALVQEAAALARRISPHLPHLEK